jgi:hypothetical protein
LYVPQLFLFGDELLQELSFGTECLNIKEIAKRADAVVTRIDGGWTVDKGCHPSSAKLTPAGLGVFLEDIGCRSGGGAKPPSTSAPTASVENVTILQRRPNSTIANERLGSFLMVVERHKYAGPTNIGFSGPIVEQEIDVVHINSRPYRIETIGDEHATVLLPEKTLWSNKEDLTEDQVRAMVTSPHDVWVRQFDPGRDDGRLRTIGILRLALETVGVVLSGYGCVSGPVQFGNLSLVTVNGCQYRVDNLGGFDGVCLPGDTVRYM